MTQWNATSPASRLLGLSIALGVTIGLCIALAARHRVVENHAEPAVTVVFLRPLPPTPLPPVPSTHPAAQARRSVTTVRRATSEPISIGPQLYRDTDVAAQAPSLPTPAPADPRGSAPLRTDVQTLRRAIAGAEGNVQRLARTSGNELDTRRPTRSELLSSAVAETAVPDCLAPNAGGSLLSVPIIAYMALKGKCK